MDMGASELLQQQQQQQEMLLRGRGGSAITEPMQRPVPSARPSQAVLHAPSGGTPGMAPSALSSSMTTALDTVKSKVAAATHTVSTPGRAATPVALRIAGGSAAHAHGASELLPRAPLMGSHVPRTPLLDSAHRAVDAGNHWEQGARGDSLVSASEPGRTPIAREAIDRAGVFKPLNGHHDRDVPGLASQASQASRSGRVQLSAASPSLSASAAPQAADGRGAAGHWQLPPRVSSYQPSTKLPKELSEPLKLMQQLAVQRPPHELTPRETAKPALLTVPSPRDPAAAPPRSAMRGTPTAAASPSVSAGLPSASRRSAGGGGSLGAVQPLGSAYDSMRSSAGSAGTFAGMGEATGVRLASDAAGRPLLSPAVVVDPVQARRAARRYG